MPFFHLTPELLQKGLTGLGIAAGQVKQLDTETKQALTRFALAAIASGDANGYVKERLEWLERRDRQPRQASTTRASARVVVEGELVDEPKGRRR